jgi:hypothetical protein
LEARSIEGALKELAMPKAKTRTVADLPAGEATPKPTRLRAEMQIAAFRAWTTVGTRFFRRWDPVVKKQEAKEPDAPDGKIALPKELFVEFGEWVAGSPFRRPA